LINHTAADAATVDEDSIRAPYVRSVEDAVGEFGGGDAIVDFSGYRSSIAALAREDNGVVDAEPGHVNAEGKRGSGHKYLGRDIAASISSAEKNSISPRRGN
jgi:hypothetical protein